MSETALERLLMRTTWCAEPARLGNLAQRPPIRRIQARASAVDPLSWSAFIGRLRADLSNCQQVPQILVIDIMMPGLDGWRLLGQLRHHPVTAPIPIVVSTIVSEKGLALSLGAVDFIQKPVSRRIFLTALDQVWRATGPDSH